MSFTVIIIVAVILSIAFHFIGVYANAKKIVWIMLVIMWAAAINIFMSEIKEEKYQEIEKLKGKYKDTDQLIKDAGDEISVYEMIEIKKSHIKHEPKR